MLVKDIMTRDVVTITPDITLKELVGILTEHHINGVPVIGRNGELAGVVTMTDLLKILKDINYWRNLEKVKPGMGVVDALVKEKEQVTVEKVMTRAVNTVLEEDSLERVIDLMCTHNIHTIPVVKDNKLAGVVGATDIIRVNFS